ncbi:MAG: hypothetical protein QG635_2384 [Bacteroidota bacterium]|nr:hypothetical protein [Bacteroidota bacterium]
MKKNSNKYFKLIEANLPDMERYALFLTRSRDFAEDLVSEAIIKGYDTYQNIRKESAFRSFMFTIIIRTYYSEKRKRSRYSDIDNPEFRSLYSKALNPEEITDIALMYEEIEKMSEKDREIIILAELMELPLKEISEMLEISVTNAKVRVHRAKKKLASTIGCGLDNKQLPALVNNN